MQVLSLLRKSLPFFIFLPLLAGKAPDKMLQALERFRLEVPPGWAYLQTTTAEGRTRIENYDPARPELLRWQLVSDSGKSPDQKQQEEYLQTKARRSSAWNAPRLEKLLDLDSGEELTAPDGWLLCRFRLKQAGPDDTAAEHLRVKIRLHLASGGVDRVEIENQEPFSVSFGVRIQETRTVMELSLPEEKRPALLQKATLHVRGRFLWVKEMAQDMTITWSDYKSRIGSAKN